MRLEDIGFYTLCDARTGQASDKSPLWRCELLLTDKCNFKCPYCMPLREDCRGDISFDTAKDVVNYWADEGLKHIRFSGGEPTLYKHLSDLVSLSHQRGIKRIAISTNGSRKLNLYKKLIDCGVNDFSISLDACCSSFGTKMSGGIDVWDRLISNISELSKITYVSAGMVFTEDNISQANESIKFASELGVSDIRIITAAQYNKRVDFVSTIDKKLLEKHPILAYRAKNYSIGRNVRGIKKDDCHKCYLVLDDMAIAGDAHYPCIIYLRQGGAPIGKINGDTKNIRQERTKWFKDHDCYNDSICRNNCLDVCVNYNNKARQNCKFK